MPTIIPGQTSTTSFYLGLGEIGIINAGDVFTYFGSGSAVLGGSSRELRLAGSITSTATGYGYWGFDPTLIYVEASGGIHAVTGVDVFEGTTVELDNAGTILAVDDAVRMSGLAGLNFVADVTNSGSAEGYVHAFTVSGAALWFTLSNTGTVTSDNHAILLSAEIQTNLDLDNSGTITGRIETTHQVEPTDQDSAGSDSIVNSGTIEGNIALGHGHDSVENTGSIIGSVEGGNGNDRIDNRGGTIIGVIYGGAGNDILLASTTDGDTLRGGDGDDRLIGGNVADELIGGSGEDLIFGGAGNDYLSGEGDNDTIDGGAGHDTMEGGDGEDLMLGRDGNDTMYGGFGNDTLNGGDGDDILLLQDGDDRGIGGDGNDSIAGDSGNDSLIGGAGSDSLEGHDGDDFLWGETGNDLLLGSQGNDSLFGGDGDDTIRGGEDADRLAGGAGHDVLEGDKGNDTLNGQLGDDYLVGGDGDDLLRGGDGNDTIEGGAGDDRIFSEAGDDSLTGGDGADSFIFERGMGVDVITDFDVLNDMAYFTNIASRAAVLSIATQDGSDTVFDFGQGDMAIFRNVTIGALAEAWT